MTQNMTQVTYWKGVVIPGSRVPGGDLSEFSNVPTDQSLDSLSGHFRIFQYKSGHRYSTDDLLVAWFGTTYAPRAERVLDLGSGIGSVAMVAAWRLAQAQFVTVEAQEISVALARKSARYNGIENRMDQRTGDFRTPGLLRAGESFDLILGSPPYFPLESGLHADHEQKVACRFEVRGTIADYAQVASEHLAHGGVFACVFPIEPPHQLERVWDAARDAGLAVIRFRKVVLKEGEPPLLGLFLMMRQSDVHESMRSGVFFEDAPLIIRTAAGQIHPEYSLVKMSIGFHPF